MNGGIFIHILIIGQDPRYDILELELSKKYQVIRSNDINIDLSIYDIIILPMKGINDSISLDNLKNTKDTCIIYTGINNLGNLNREVISFLDDLDIKNENDNITVEGIIDYIKDIKHDKICLLGYGNIGKKLYQKLNNNINSIGVIDKKDKELLGSMAFYTNDSIMKEKLINCDLIINTVPHNIITLSNSSNLDTPILDIASIPYAVSKEVIDKNNLNYYLYSGIPGKYDPVRSGKILLKKIRGGK